MLPSLPAGERGRGVVIVVVDQIDKTTLEISPADDEVYSDMSMLGDELPDHSPRFVLLSYPLTLVRFFFFSFCGFLFPHGFSEVRFGGFFWRKFVEWRVKREEVCMDAVAHGRCMRRRRRSGITITTSENWCCGIDLIAVLYKKMRQRLMKRFESRYSLRGGYPYPMSSSTIYQ